MRETDAGNCKGGPVRVPRTVRRNGHTLFVDAHTSARMARIRQKATSAELTVRSVVTKLGFRYRTANRDLPGSPDLANRKRRWVIFVHGCFWHAHEGCSRATLPKRNREFWSTKLEGNRSRDEAAIDALKRIEYKAIVIWECETRELWALEELLNEELGDLY